MFLFWNVPGNAQNFHYNINTSPAYFDQPGALKKAGISDVSCIYKDSRGFMWFGTANGLYRFDGTHVQYTHHINGDTNSLSNNSILNIIEDNAGNLWIGTAAGGLLLNAYTLKCTRIKDDTHKYTGYKINFFSNDKKTIWGATDDGLYRYNTEKKYLQKIWEGKEKNDGHPFVIANIAFYGNDSLVLGTLSGVVFINKNNLGYRKAPFIENGREINLVISAVHVDDAGEIWLGSWSYGLLHYNKALHNFSSWKWQEDKPGGVANIVSNITTVRTGNERVLYFGSGLGLFKMPMLPGTAKPDEKNITLFVHDDKIPNSISAGAVINFYKDDIDNLWIALDAEPGINKISLTRSMFNTLPVKRDGFIRESQQIILGGRRYYCISNWHNFPALQILDSTMQPVKTFMRMPPTDKHPDAANASAVAVDKQDRLWVSSWRGIVVMDKAFNILKIINHFGPDSLSKAKNNYILISGDSVWIASYKNGVDIFSTGYKRLGHIAKNEHGLNEDLIWKMHRDKQGRIWLLGNAFFHRYDAASQHFKPFSFSSDNTVPSPVDIAERKDGSFLIATKNGLVDFDPATEKYRYISSPLLQKEDNINSVCVDEHDNAWFLTATHLVEYDFATGNFILYGKEDGLDISNELMSIRFIDKNKFLIGQQFSFSIFTPNVSKNISVPPKVIITGLNVNDSSITVTDDPINLQLRYDQNRISFNFSAINYVRPEQNQFAYRLKGADTGWTYTYNGFVSYANLAPGNYLFEVKVQNYAGAWSTTRSVSIIISPPFWKTWWFISLVMLAFIILFFAVVRYIAQRNLKERILRLEKKQAIEKERNRIARDMHDDLGSGLTKIAILSEVAKTQLQQPDKAKEQLENISVSSRELVDSMQDIIWVLNPKNDTLESLASYLREYALKFFEQPETSLQFKYPHEIPPVKLTEEQRRNIFLVIKETFNNIAKHAECNNVILQLEKISNTINFTIEDDGKGFDNSSTRTFGNGLQNMKTRMQQINGKYSITSQPGNTVTTISFIP